MCREENTHAPSDLSLHSDISSQARERNEHGTALWTGVGVWGSGFGHVRGGGERGDPFS